MTHMRSPGLLFIIAATSSGTVASVPQESAAIEATYSAPTNVTVHEPIFVDVSFRNRSESAIHLDLGTNRKGRFVFALVKPNGGTVDARLPLESGGLGRVSIAPGERYEGRLLLNEWVNVNEVGKYIVAVKLDGSVESDAGANPGSAPEGVLTLLVGPRNDDALRSACDRLYQTAVTSADGYARWEAARAIGFVPDAVAVKYLDRVLESTHDDDAIDAIVIKGLMRLGTSEAHDVVERAAHAVDLPRAVLAADALKRWPAKN